ncbi:Putative odorant-binding protein A10 [Eumeta japonica]|uniref:Odorant-binding protein A10 n=1 Tax=Eumeta variegata TaxID=151549 RepID=A0A4C1T0Y2_EUMVA|nr:Putative odorant-binding protein A10 [Eumeta japonica]
MKAVSILALCAAAVAAAADSTYDPKYDSFNIDEVAGNPRLLRNYGNCFLDKGPCTAEGSVFKGLIDEALRTDCGKCTPVQRKSIRTAVRAFRKDLPELWEEIVKKYDAKGEYRASFQKFLEASD